MKLSTVDPGAEAVREAVERYSSLYPDFAEALRVYGAIMEAQQEALEKIRCPVGPLEEVVVQAKTQLGDTLLEPGEVPVDGKEFRALIEKICEGIARNSPSGLDFSGELLEWEGLSEDGLPSTRDSVLAGEDTGFDTEEGLGESGKNLVAGILWEGLVPFYRACGSMLTDGLEQSLWQKAFCPICGGAPLMGMYRRGDGLWVIECSLCHTGWNIQRASCAVCNESQGSLEYLYLEEDSSRRVNYCKVCRKYIKTVDLRNSEEEALLPLENIISADLDRAAREQGLRPAGGRAPRVGA